jgi:hypothetical protein
VRVTERSDRVEPLLVRHDKQYVGPGHNVILIPQSREKNLGSILDESSEQK